MTVATVDVQTGTRLLWRTIEEFYEPGQKVELLIGIDKDLAGAELATLQNSLLQSGLQLLSPIQIGSYPWPNTLRLRFRRPASSGQVGFIPLIPPIAIILAGLGVAVFLGWEVNKVIDAITRNLVPITLIAVGGFVLYGYVTSRRRVAA